MLRDEVIRTSHEGEELSYERGGVREERCGVQMRDEAEGVRDESEQC